MLEHLRTRLELNDARLPIVLKDCGNTVSSTIPILIDHLRGTDRLQPGVTNMLVGFGVGWSWAGCIWKETWNE
jgi:3-oxoacyl-[acyl-carrier-protein] synthase-3